MGAQRAGEVRRLADDPACLTANSLVRVDEATAAEARIEVEAAGDALDVMTGERPPDVFEVFR